MNDHRALALLPAPSGGLGWSPAVFDAATLTEFALACQGPQKDKKTEVTPADARRAFAQRGQPIFGEKKRAHADGTTP